MPRFRRALLTLVLASGLAGCEAPTDVPGGGTEPAARALTLSSVRFQSKYLVGAERFKADVTIGQGGSGTLTHYGMATRLGQELYPLKPPVPVIDGGELTLTVGPLPNLTEAGPLTVEFWVVDSEGKESNRLTQEVVIQ